jgi:CheY-like chemotaxis protein
MPRKTVLVVEDEALIALDVQMTLEDLDHDIVVAGSNAAAEAALALQRFDLAILDYRLMDGNTDRLARRLRQAGIPFVVCSGSASVTELGEVFQNTTFLPKPFTTDRLVEAVSAIPSGSAQ